MDAMDSTTMPRQAYSSGILLSSFSIVIVLLIIPPMCWHFRNRNIGATALVAWVILMNFQSFVNALIWPTDDIGTWFSGDGLCDVQIKLQVASQVALPAAFACVLRALANVMDTDRTTLGLTKAQRRREYAIDLTWVLVLPMLQMLFHYIVQTSRYYIWGVSGCVPSVSASWVTVVLILVPPTVWTFICAYYAILIIIRLQRYRTSFNAILANSNTNKSRFLRLFLICIIWILASVPVQCYIFYRNLSVEHVPYSWSEVHDPETWNLIEMVPSEGRILYDRYVWLGAGVCVFLFFGFGKDAVSMYRSALLGFGLGKVIPILDPDHRSSKGSMARTLSSIGSKAKLYFKRKDSVSTWTTDSDVSRSTSTTSPLSPKQITFLETISEHPPTPAKTSRISGWLKAQSSQPSDTGRGRPSQLDESRLKRLTTRLLSKKATATPTNNPLPLGNITGQQVTVEAEVSSGLPSPTLMEHFRTTSEEVLVRKEVRQGSEIAGTIAGKTYNGC